MHILQQFEIVIICMPFIFRPIYAIFWSELKKNEIILSFARYLANVRIILLHFLYVRYNLKTTYICRHICILLSKVTMLKLFPIHHTKYQCPSFKYYIKGASQVQWLVLAPGPSLLYRALHGPHSI